MNQNKEKSLPNKKEEYQYQKVKGNGKHHDNNLIEVQSFGFDPDKKLNDIQHNLEENKQKEIHQREKEEEDKKQQEHNIINFRRQLKIEILNQHYIDKRENNNKNQKTNNFTRFSNILINALTTHQEYLKE
jgi:hypothetical protein